MMKKRLLALLLCLVMLVGLVPMALAGDSEETPPAGDGAGTASRTIRFVTNDGRPNPIVAEIVVDFAEESNTTTLTANNKTLPAAPTRTNYTFNGWYGTLNLDTNELSDSFTADSNITRSTQWPIKTIWAGWTPIEYTITFNANYEGASPATRNQEFTCETADDDNAEFKYVRMGIGDNFYYAYLTPNTFTREGFTFAGWSTTANGSAAYENRSYAKMNDLFGSGTTATLYAVWTPNSTTPPAAETVTVTYKNEQGEYAALKLDENTTVTIDPGTGGSAEVWTGAATADNEIKTINSKQSYTAAENCTLSNAETSILKSIGWKWDATKKTFTAVYATECVVSYSCYHCYGTADTVKLPIYTEIKINPNGGSFAGVKTVTTKKLTAASYTLSAPTRTGYTFYGWTYDSTTKTFTAVWDHPYSTYCDIYYYDYDDGKYEYAEFYYGTTIVIDPNGGKAKLNGSQFSTAQYFDIKKDYTLSDASRTGYTFYGWDLTKVGSAYYFTAKWAPSTTVPYMLNGEDHYAYIKGYPNGTFKPTANITRAEVSVIFYRLLTDSARKTYSTSYNTFKDVPATAWYATAVSTMAKLGIVNGSGGYFRPNDYITRAEIAAMIARCDGGYYTGSYTGFSDVYGHWASSYIGRAYELGWINGYGTTYKPDQYVTRAETVSIVNRVLNRTPQYSSDLVKYMTTFTDVSTAEWYYLDVQEAANSHDYTRKANGYEYWNKLIADPSWL